MDSTPTTLHTVVFAAVFIALYVAHEVADHWLQTEHQANTKGHPGWAGRAACAGHVVSYTGAGLLAVTAVVGLLDLPVDPARAAAGLAVSAVTHYFADRRTPLRRLAQLAGHADFWTYGEVRPGHDDNPSLGTGAYAMDQSFHKLWILVAALIIAV